DGGADRQGAAGGEADVTGGGHGTPGEVEVPGRGHVDAALRAGDVDEHGRIRVRGGQVTRVIQVDVAAVAHGRREAVDLRPQGPRGGAGPVAGDQPEEVGRHQFAAFDGAGGLEGQLVAGRVEGIGQDDVAGRALD